MREVAAECEKPVMLYSIGKDSSVMLHLARKAFYPEKIPFPFLHIDTTWKFHEMIEFRDATAKKYDLNMLVYTNMEGVRQGINPFDHGAAYTDIMKTQALKAALKQYGFTAAFGGGRRDEEKSRAKERIFSFRSKEQTWDPKNQRPEMWKLYNTKIHKGESIRVFPLSNWTEADIWQYIQRENIEIVSLYYAKERPCIYRDGNIIMVDDDRLSFFPVKKSSIRKYVSGPLAAIPLPEEWNPMPILWTRSLQRPWAPFIPKGPAGSSTMKRPAAWNAEKGRDISNEGSFKISDLWKCRRWKIHPDRSFVI